jgi:hypothetical protein
MRVSHEVPKQLFKDSVLFNDYPYVLGHLIKLDEEYKEFYKKQLAGATFSILDNSAFELGSSISDTELISVARELRPTHLILPDTINNKATTLFTSERFLKGYQQSLKDLFITPIGVVQGETFIELLECVMKYRQLGVSYIAIPFDCIKGADYSMVRFLFMRFLLNTIGEVELGKLSIHFLGIQSPQEMRLYGPDMKKFITSIDTSSPIIHGAELNEFGTWGCSAKKPRLKLADNLDMELGLDQLRVIKENIKQFRKYISL